MPARDATDIDASNEFPSPDSESVGVEIMEHSPTSGSGGIEVNEHSPVSGSDVVELNKHFFATPPRHMSEYQWKMNTLKEENKSLKHALKKSQKRGDHYRKKVEKLETETKNLEIQVWYSSVGG